MEWLSLCPSPVTLPGEAQARPSQATNERARTESTLVAMGLDVNDIWIAAIALEHNLVLVTKDGMAKMRGRAFTKDGMAKIREAAPSLRIENWL